VTGEHHATPRPLSPIFHTRTRKRSLTRYDFSCNPRQAFFYDGYHGTVNEPYPGHPDAHYPRLQVRGSRAVSSACPRYRLSLHTHVVQRVHVRNGRVGGRAVVDAMMGKGRGLPDLAHITYRVWSVSV
jgi:hypothetical protein